MESQVLLVRRSHGAAAVAQQQQHGAGFPGGMKRFSGVSPLGKLQQWRFHVEKSVTLRPPRKTSAVEVRAKKTGLGESVVHLLWFGVAGLEDAIWSFIVFRACESLFSPSIFISDAQPLQTSGLTLNPLRTV